MIKTLKYLPLFVFGFVAPAQAGMVPTADSPAFQRDISIDAGIAVELGSKTQTTTTATEDPEDCPPEDWDGGEYGHYEEVEPTTSSVSTTTSTSRVLNYQRANIKVSQNTVATLANNNGEIAIGAAHKLGDLAAASASVNLSGEVEGSVSISPVRNVALYVETENQGINYGVQYQAGDVAVQAYYRPQANAYGVGVALNIGGSEPKAIEAKPLTPEAKPQAQPQAKPVAKPPVQAPSLTAPTYIRGRG